MWNLILFGLFAVRKRWIFWLAIPITALLALRFGNKDAGYYRGYSAGSILSPDSWVDTPGSIIFGDASGVTASQLNKILGEMRGENMPGFIIFLLLFLASVGAAYLASFAYAHIYGDISDVLEDDQARQYFIRRYEQTIGPYPKAAFLEDAFGFRLVNFIYDLSIADNWRLQLADAPESFITKVAIPIQSEQDEQLGKALKLVM